MTVITNPLEAAPANGDITNNKQISGGILGNLFQSRALRYNADDARVLKAFQNLWLNPREGADHGCRAMNSVGSEGAVGRYHQEHPRVLAHIQGGVKLYDKLLRGWNIVTKRYSFSNVNKPNHLTT